MEGGFQCSLTLPSAERLELGRSSGGAAAVAPLLGLLLLSSDGGGVDPLFLFWCHLPSKISFQALFQNVIVLIENWVSNAMSLIPVIHQLTCPGPTCRGRS